MLDHEAPAQKKTSDVKFNHRFQHAGSMFLKVLTNVDGIINAEAEDTRMCMHDHGLR